MQYEIIEQYPFKIYRIKNKESIINEIAQIKKAVQNNYIESNKLNIAMAENNFPSFEDFLEIKKELLELKKKLNLNINEETAALFLSGYNELAILFEDDEIEDIMINKINSNIFIFHRKYGLCKSNIVFTEKEYKEFISRLQNSSGKILNDENPVIDARLIDGSRINAVSKKISPFSPAITIRKFTKKPLSIANLIEKGTISSDAASFLWLCIDGLKILPQNMLIVGGSGSGKTTLLFALSSFIRYSDRIISIEDTPEINLADRENWVSLEAKIINNEKEITMDFLLKNSLRMRPDRIIVGEVRGKEAKTLFTAMDTGHRGVLGTLHANNSKEAISRLKNPPMNVPEATIPVLNLIVTIKKEFREEGFFRYVSDIAELERMENKVLISNVYEYSNEEKVLLRSDIPSRTLENIAKATAVSKKELYDEIELRKDILEHIIKKGILDYHDFTKEIQRFYKDPKGYLQEL